MGDEVGDALGHLIGVLDFSLFYTLRQQPSPEIARDTWAPTTGITTTQNVGCSSVQNVEDAEH